MGKKQTLLSIWSLLKKEYPHAHCALDHKNPFELLIATILSAQCTDERVNLVTKVLFKRFSHPAALASADIKEIESIIHSTGFYRNKAKNIRDTATLLVNSFGGVVPRTMEELLVLPGVARKTANVVLGNAYGIVSGIVVDTHVTRLSDRLGFSKHKDAVKIEEDLCKLIPKEDWIIFSHVLIWHGRKICDARKPRCDTCPALSLCPYPK
jgi:endonuclease III